MVTKLERDQAFKRIVPMASLGVATLGVALGVLTLARTGPLGRRIYYQDGQYLVKVRHGQWYDLQAFVQPSNPDVVAIYSEVGPDSWGLYDWVCQNIDYHLDIGEYWETPSETLAWGEADCEGTAILLCSMLRNFTNAYVVVGDYYGYGHAWVAEGDQIYETTYTSARSVPDPNDYQAFCLFNDQEVIELWPGALEDIFSLRRNEGTKLNLMAQAIGDEVPPECPSLWPPLVVGTVMGGILGTGFAMILQKGE
ncbi:hypothetical protein ES703_40752 [subsurface metagenome]